MSDHEDSIEGTALYNFYKAQSKDPPAIAAKPRPRGRHVPAKIFGSKAASAGPAAPTSPIEDDLYAPLSPRPKASAREHVSAPTSNKRSASATPSSELRIRPLPQQHAGHTPITRTPPLAPALNKETSSEPQHPTPTASGFPWATVLALAVLTICSVEFLRYVSRTSSQHPRLDIFAAHDLETLYANSSSIVSLFNDLSLTTPDCNIRIAIDQAAHDVKLLDQPASDMMVSTWSHNSTLAKDALDRFLSRLECAKQRTEQAQDCYLRYERVLAAHVDRSQTTLRQHAQNNSKLAPAPANWSAAALRNSAYYLIWGSDEEKVIGRKYSQQYDRAKDAVESTAAIGLVLHEELEKFSRMRNRMNTVSVDLSRADWESVQLSLLSCLGWENKNEDQVRAKVEKLKTASPGWAV